MKKILISICVAFLLSGFTELPENNDQLSVESTSKDWEVQMNGDSYVKAVYPKGQLELVLNIGNVLPNSAECLSNKRIKDIKIDLTIRKVVQAGDRDWEKSFEKTRIDFSGKDGGERKVVASNLIKNNLRFETGAVVNVGTLSFLHRLPVKIL